MYQTSHVIGGFLDLKLSIFGCPIQGQCTWKVNAQIPNGPQAAPTPTVSASGPSEISTKSGKNEFNPVQPILHNGPNAQRM